MTTDDFYDNYLVATDSPEAAEKATMERIKAAARKEEKIE